MRVMDWPLETKTFPETALVESFVELISQVIFELGRPFADVNFPSDTQRNHLKKSLYLLKIHERSPNLSFHMLYDMYQQPSTVHQLHHSLKKRISRESTMNQDDIPGIMQLLERIDDWFTLSLETVNIKHVIKIKARTDLLTEFEIKKPHPQQVSSYELEIQQLHMVLGELRQYQRLWHILFSL